MVFYILQVSGGELVMVMLLALLLFGSKSIPDIMRTVAKGMREFRRATNDIRREIEDYTTDVRKDIDDATSGVRNDLNDITSGISRDVDDITTGVSKDFEEINSNVNRDVSDINTNLSKNVDNTESVQPDASSARVEDPVPLENNNSPSTKATVSSPTGETNEIKQGFETHFTD